MRLTGSGWCPLNESLRLGTIAGVRVGINWSVLAIFALVAFSLATGRFPAAYPDASTGAYVAAGLVASVLFFLSLLAHEIAHAVVAQRNGIEVEGITLWLFGGVARLGGEAADPGADMRIAGVGPLVSVLLGGLFLGLAAIAGATGLPDLATGVLGWLGVINLALAVFNLIPGAPLDGGRVLRAFLWRRRGDRLSASITAARAGRVVGFLLVALGLFEFAFAAGFGGLWLVLIGWFLLNAANGEEQHARVRGVLGDLRVAEVMSPEPTAAPAHLSVRDFIEQYVFTHQYSTFPLTGEGARPEGLITLRRVKAVPAEARQTTSIRQIACPMEEVPVARPDDRLADVLPRMGGCADGRVLVVDDGRLVGILSPTDVAHRLQVADLRDPRLAEHV